MNIREVEPVDFWTPEGTKQADKIMLYNFHGYDFDGSDSSVSYRLGTNGEEGWRSCIEGSVAVPDSIVQAWGEDDDPIFEYVLQQLNLTEV